MRAVHSARFFRPVGVPSSGSNTLNRSVMDPSSRAAFAGGVRLEQQLIEPIVVVVVVCDDCFRRLAQQGVEILVGGELDEFADHVEGLVGA
jgi:hypothetical protein